MTMPNVSKHRRSATRVRQGAGRRAGAERAAGDRATCPPPADAPPSSDVAAAPELREAKAAKSARVGVPGPKAVAKAAMGFRERKRVIRNLLRAVRSGRLQSAGQLGAWGEALLAARLIADASEGLSLTSAGRAMLAEMSLKHQASADALAPPGTPAPAFLLIARGRSRPDGEWDSEQEATIAPG